MSDSKKETKVILLIKLKPTEETHNPDLIEMGEHLDQESLKALKNAHFDSEYFNQKRSTKEYNYKQGKVKFKFNVRHQSKTRRKKESISRIMQRRREFH